MRITRKLGLLVGLPLVAVVGFAALAVVTTYGSASGAEHLRRLVAASAAAGELVGRLQAERSEAVLLLTGEADAEGYQNRVEATDAAAAAFIRARDELPELPGATAGLVERIDGQLSRLDGLRQEVTGGGRASAVAFSYRITIASLISFRSSVGQAGGASAEVADHLRAAAAVSQASEAAGLLDVAALRSVGQGPLSPSTVQEITAAQTARLQAQQDFDASATPSWRAMWDRAQVGEAALEAQELEDQVARTPVGAVLRLDAASWAQVMSVQLERLGEVEAVIDADILAEVSALRDEQRRLVAAQVAGVVLTVALAVGLTVGLGRPVVRGLRGLRDAADEVATRELPEAVARLESRQEELGMLSAEQFAEQQPAPIEVRGRDELAELAVSFNRVHREAVRTAAAQAVLRLRVGQMFVSLARRGQQQAGALTAVMDELERDEQDPKRLKRLFEMDLMITLLARSNDSLLVLGGAASARVPVEHDLPLADVLKGAAGRVREYARVDTGVVDEALVRAGVVDDLTLLLAELIDNATRFSDPQHGVMINARWLGNRAVIQVNDEGLGIPAPQRAELNLRLASPAALDLYAVRHMGLTVVSRLAHQHQIRVELYPNAESGGRGTTAEVTLPASLVGPDHAAAGGGRRLGSPGTTRTGNVTAPTTAARAPWPSAESSATVELPAARTAAPEGQGTPPLVIYNEVRSMWFIPPAEPESGLGGQPAGGWGTAADPGWVAAQAAARPVPAGTTANGLPKRRRGEQLVPGGVSPAPPPPSAARPVPGRIPDPARVSAAASAFSRGLATGIPTHAPRPEV